MAAVLEGLLLLTAAAVAPAKVPAPSAELLEFLAEWPDEAEQRLLDGQARPEGKDDAKHEKDKRDATTR